MFFGEGRNSLFGTCPQGKIIVEDLHPNTGRTHHSFDLFKTVICCNLPCSISEDATHNAQDSTAETVVRATSFSKRR